MTTATYAQDLRNSIEYKRYGQLANAIGDQLNSQKDRFLKGHILEKSISTYSNGRIEHIDANGKDLLDKTTGKSIEFKYSANGMFTKTKRQKKTVKVKIKNSLGNDKGITIANPADYYIIAQQDALGVISYEDLNPYLEAVSDGIEANIPLDKLEWICKPNDFIGIDTTKIDIKDKIDSLVNSIIGEI